MYLRKWAAALAALLLLSACATKVENIKQDIQTNQLELGQGYLMMTIETNADLHRIVIGGEKTIEVSQEDVRKGSNHILVALPAGDYYFERVTTNTLAGKVYYDFDDEDEEQDWRFSVAPNGISYVGSFRVRNSNWGFYSSFTLINQSSQALEYLEENFPALLSNHNVSYQGPGEDAFFDVVKSIPQRDNTEVQQ